MNALHRVNRALAIGLGAASIALAGCAAITTTKRVEVTLSGAEQVPQVMTGATGSGIFVVDAERGVSGSVTVSGLAPTAAHIHTGARGANGGVAIGLVKTSENTWSVPAGARFSDAQYQSFLAGETYVNVHTATNKGGEIRAQLRP
jgi:hypothetical protein